MSYLPLYIALSLLMVDGLIEVGFVGSMVGFLHDRAGKYFTVNAPQGTFNLHGKPAGLLVNQGHTSNGAAGTAVVLVGIGGLLTIWYEKRRQGQRRKQPSPSSQIQSTDYGQQHEQYNDSRGGPSRLFLFWTLMTVLSAMLTLAALIYTFIVTYQTDHQTINLSVAAANPEPAFYPLDKWTPENWFVAVLALPLAHESDRRDIRNHLRLMRGWRWNLIPLFVLGVVVVALAVWEVVRGRVRGRRGGGGVGKRWVQGDEAREKFRHSKGSSGV
ncbi:hypothetical protein HRR83_001623 [Exophiala dermatitidis]|uniref:Uncharacterized protein n=2 Tax=Exophiala dermatitidis TaxID=5970 RepID=H6C5W0_EXODN|nr:uncharacterized protein HMPREF1120_07105 [Exophiala dermatitidis NIH/UT8656]KAJ4516295.1 hypothetical protein HRR73_004757 [Exophiala dermatitidis]EHY59106.1 hypothetical protein HMPREF1120_07105 [Exophiala dermatitidis NIH/UT8656]KAJ4523103.1 hypothetical protein HRR75_001501 [Exophiala dermatitidis]KAJ4526430.1 hypothetical protein HRR74_001627 [Exophiala dermatitidis]KAJ4532326.1 hypothetical protein HRR76_007324 [Exophiala dermatitidis]